MTFNPFSSETKPLPLVTGGMVTVYGKTQPHLFHVVMASPNYRSLVLASTSARIMLTVLWENNEYKNLLTGEELKIRMPITKKHVLMRTATKDGLNDLLDESLVGHTWTLYMDSVEERSWGNTTRPDVIVKRQSVFAKRDSAIEDEYPGGSFHWRSSILCLRRSTDGPHTASPHNPCSYRPYFFST